MINDKIIILGWSIPLNVDNVLLGTVPFLGIGRLGGRLERHQLEGCQ